MHDHHQHLAVLVGALGSAGDNPALGVGKEAGEALCYQWTRDREREMGRQEAARNTARDGRGGRAARRAGCAMRGSNPPGPGARRAGRVTGGSNCRGQGTRCRQEQAARAEAARRGVARGIRRRTEARHKTASNPPNSSSLLLPRGNQSTTNHLHLQFKPPHGMDCVG